MINDEEDLLESVKEFVKANLNARIQAINAEKDDDFTIAELAATDTNFLIAGEMTEIPARAFVQFAILPDIDSSNNQGNYTSTFTIAVEHVFENPKRAGVYKQSLRYMRAIYETLLQYEPSANEVQGIQISKAVPMNIQFNQRQLVVSGVNMVVTLG